ncbi:Sec63 complex subunit SEC66 [Aspergillus clavatus NRRL 1]|uniref:Translocation protein (Sec66), putative n=1 Tax=Aspergillus clavatus (strain ATCC 1007 / CBS 513.65 / DSM 816 / NCTC 3887 / NRRL 1 / QM 1276 / 107) TaxID=344612 RepID=A1C3W5_ASPCL|nr:translocation protein (Sec66), putative [Aspergillus clavatus NRRL 1]EAW15105.1 translocation protein (Sec66), putative [Aspergillus clavatus NRRL 1]
MVDWLSLAVPLAYLGVLLGSLATFSSLYRKRKATKATSLEPWFPPHLQRDIYFSLLHLDPPASSSGKEKKAPAVPESVLKAALLRRATEDIKRVMALRSQKQALAMLLQRGSVGDDLWQRFQRAEKEMEDEVRDVVAEANAYVPGWGQTIFQSANEMLNNVIFRERMETYQSKVKEEREWWDKKKASIQEGFMKELDAEGSGPAKVEQASSVTTTTNSTSGTMTPESSAAPSTVAESDDEAVLVNADDTAGGSGSASKKKKKGKK